MIKNRLKINLVRTKFSTFAYILPKLFRKYTVYDSPHSNQLNKPTANIIHTTTFTDLLFILCPLTNINCNDRCVEVTVFLMLSRFASLLEVSCLTIS